MNQRHVHNTTALEDTKLSYNAFYIIFYIIHITIHNSECDLENTPSFTTLSLYEIPVPPDFNENLVSSTEFYAVKENNNVFGEINSSKVTEFQSYLIRIQ